LHQPPPAVHQDEHTHNGEPNALGSDGQHEQTRNSDQSNYGSDHQAAGAAYPKPEQGAKNLAAIKRINGQQIENQQTTVDEQNRAQETLDVGQSIGPVESPRPKGKAG
jgi:hypothetical protein